MTRLALDGHKKSLGKDHEVMKKCARNFAILVAEKLKDKEKTRELVKNYPRVLEVQPLGRNIKKLLGRGGSSRLITRKK